MNEVISKEQIFLGKLKAILDTFDSIDMLVDDINKMIEELPESQSRVDQLLSDYYHRLEDDNLSDIEIVNIGKKIHEVRAKRNDENSVSKLIHCYDTNKNKIMYSNKANRQMFYQAISNLRKTLHEDYKYRILTEKDLKDLSKNKKSLSDCKEEIKEDKTRRKRRKGITKEQIEECLSKGLKTSEIAKMYKVFPSYVSNMKKKYGLSKEV